jgi:hypothetical protein
LNQFASLHRQVAKLALLLTALFDLRHHSQFSVPPKELPVSVRDFISRHVRSVEQLEVLLLFQKHPSTTLSAKEVYEAILSTPQSIQRWLDELTGSGLLMKVVEPGAGYHRCADAALNEQIADLAEAYSSAPVRVIEAIYKREAGAAQSFADAFKINNGNQTS